MYMFSLVLVFAFPIYLEQPSFDKEVLLEFPVVPFESTTFEQDDEIDIVKGLASGNPAITLPEVCNRLIADESLPIVLRSWTLRKKMYLACIEDCNIVDALAWGRDWIHRYGASDPDSFKVHCLMANFVGSQKCYEYSPLYSDVKAFFQELFLALSHNDVLEIQAHLIYASALEGFLAIYPSVHDESVQHMKEAMSLLSGLLEREGLDEKQRSSYERVLGKLREKLSLKLTEQIPEKPQCTEKEYLEQRRKKADSFREMKENERFMRQYMIEKGEFDPNNPGIPFSFTGKDITNPEFQRFKLRMLEEESKARSDNVD